MAFATLANLAHSARDGARLFTSWSRAIDGCELPLTEALASEWPCVGRRPFVISGGPTRGALAGLVRLASASKLALLAPRAQRPTFVPVRGGQERPARWQPPIAAELRPGLVQSPKSIAQLPSDDRRPDLACRRGRMHRRMHSQEPSACRSALD